jgi:hypothetical protein
MMLLDKLQAILKHKDYVIYSRPYELNIVGIRGDSVIPNHFDDEIHVFYKTNPHNWHYHVYKVTTDPGTFWLKNPEQPQGTAILAQGQYKDAYTMGLHQGKYKALVQHKPVTVIRDYDRDATLDFLNGTESTGLFGINIHRANSSGTTKYVDKYSAGCQVFENSSSFNEFISLCEHHLKLYGNVFTYTLIDFRAVKRETYRRIALTTGAIGVFGIGMLVLTGEKLKSIADQITDAFLNLFEHSRKN